MDLSIIIINWNTKDLLLQTVASIYNNYPANYQLEIIVVDNASSDDSVAALQTIYPSPSVKLIANKENRGFGPANNQALAIAKGRYCLLLNSDVIVQPGNLQRVIEFMDNNRQVGLCGIQILNADGTFQGSYAKYLSLSREFLILSGLGRRYINRQYPSYSESKSLQSRTVPVIQGAFMFLRSEAIREIGYLDERFFMYGEENDLSLRLQSANWQTYYLADVKIIHLGGQSTRKNWSKMVWQLQRSKVLLFRKHYGKSSAFLLKLLVSLTVLFKLLNFRLKDLIKLGKSQNTVLNNQSQNSNWFNWHDFSEFWSS